MELAARVAIVDEILEAGKEDANYDEQIIAVLNAKRSVLEYVVLVAVRDQGKTANQAREMAEEKAAAIILEAQKWQLVERNPLLAIDGRLDNGKWEGPKAHAISCEQRDATWAVVEAGQIVQDSDGSWMVVSSEGDAADNYYDRLDEAVAAVNRAGIQR